MKTSRTSTLIAPHRTVKVSATTDRPETFFDSPLLGERLMRRRKQAELISELKAMKDKREGRENDLRFLFFALGLAVSLASVIIAFDWKFYDEGNKIELGGISNEQFDDLIEIPLTEQVPPPPQQQAQQFILTEVSDEIEVESLDLNLDVEITGDMSIAAIVQVDVEELPEEETDEVFVIVENQPEPVGGFPAFYKYLGENLKYPLAARSNEISGRVYIEFIVEKDGSITNISVIKGIGGGCDEEAVRVMGNAPQWHPGKQRGRPVKVKMTMPINFTLRH